jgi:predicted TIM-barrel fold metal-dependent hydrolase
LRVHLDSRRQVAHDRTVITDCHTHLVPDRLAAAIRRFFDAVITEVPLAYGLDRRDVLDQHHAEGVGVVWNLPYAHKAGMAADLNAGMVAISAELADHPVRVVPGCTVHPADPDAAGDLRTAVAAGARVLKLHCSVGDHAIDDPRLATTLDAAGALGVPVVVHAGHDVDGTTAVDELAPLGRVAAAHPATTLILAHCGHAASGDAVALLDAHPNVYADLTPVVRHTVDLPTADIERLADRLLFGTDAPNTALTAAALHADLVARGLSATALEQILHGNAERLVPTPTAR